MADEKYIFPNSEIDEVRVITKDQITYLNNGEEVIKIQDAVMPLGADIIATSKFSSANSR